MVESSAQAVNQWYFTAPPRAHSSAGSPFLAVLLRRSRPHTRELKPQGSIFTWPISYIILHVANPKGCATLHGRLIHAAATNLAGAATMQHLVERPVYLFLSLLRKEAIEDPHLVRAILHSWLQRTSEDSRAARSLRLLARPFAHGFSAAAKIA